MDPARIALLAFFDLAGLFVLWFVYALLVALAICLFPLILVIGLIVEVTEGSDDAP